MVSKAGNVSKKRKKTKKHGERIHLTDLTLFVAVAKRHENSCFLICIRFSICYTYASKMRRLCNVSCDSLIDHSSVSCDLFRSSHRTLPGAVVLPVIFRDYSRKHVYVF